jgi:hypothetical protein
MYDHVQDTEAMRSLAANLRKKDEEAGINHEEMLARSLNTSNPLLRRPGDQELWNELINEHILEGRMGRDLFRMSVLNLIHM